MGKCESCGTTKDVAKGLCPACHADTQMMAEGGEVDSNPMKHPFKKEMKTVFMAEGGELQRKESEGMAEEPKEKFGEQMVEGEPNDDDVMSDHVAHELMEAFHNKDKPAFKDALHYLVSDIITKMQS